MAGGGTGGHLYPALNLADALRRAEPGVRILFLGARRGLEARVFPRTGHAYRLLPAQPLYRRRVWRNWRLLSSAPGVLAGLRRSFRGFEPDLVVGTGGYASGPAVLWGRLTGRRTALQEQNAAPGLVTRGLARWVDQVHLGYPEAAAELRLGSATELFCHGNPVATARPGVDPGGGTFDWPDGRVLLVVGGSQGARGLNLRLLADVERASVPWPEDVKIVWVAGPAHAAAVEARVAQLAWADRIRVVPFIERLGAQLSRVSLAVARAGAMFVAELAAAGVPSVLIPFPGAAGGHQSANARAMEAAGAAVVREEAALAPGELLNLLGEILGQEPRRRQMAEAARRRGAPEAADRIAGDLLRLLSR